MILLMIILLIIPIQNKKECYWKRGYTIWSVPCGYAYYITKADDMNPAIHGYAATHIEAMNDINFVFRQDKKKGLVICK